MLLPPPRGPDRHRGLRRAPRAAAVAEVDSGVVVAFGAPEPLDLLAHLPPAPGLSLSDRPRRVDAVLVMVVRDRKPSGERSSFPPGPRCGTLGWGPHPHRRHAAAVRHGGPGHGRALPAIDRLAGKSGLPFYTVPDVQTGRERRSRHPYRRLALAGRAPDGASLPGGPFARQRVTRLREKKSPAEIAVLRQAAKISGMAHREAMRSAAPGCGRTRSRPCWRAPSAGWAEAGPGTGASSAPARTPPSCITWRTAG